MKITKALRATTTVATLAWAAHAPTQAQTQAIFAEYTISPAAPTDYSFISTSTPTSYTGGLFSTSVPVIFDYKVANGGGYAPGAPINALLTITSSVSGRPTTSPSGIDDQPLQNINMRITLASNPAVNLLSFSNAGGDIVGFDADTTARTSGTQTRGNNVNFTSAYLNFPSHDKDNYSYGFTTVTPELAVTTTGNNNSLDPFTAAGPGSFASALGITPSPEPSALVSLAVLGGCLALGITARRRKANAC